MLPGNFPVTGPLQLCSLQRGANPDPERIWERDVGTRSAVLSPTPGALSEWTGGGGAEQPVCLGKPASCTRSDRLSESASSLQ